MKYKYKEYRNKYNPGLHIVTRKHKQTERAELHREKKQTQIDLKPTKDTKTQETIRLGDSPFPRNAARALGDRAEGDVITGVRSEAPAPAIWSLMMQSANQCHQ